MSTNARRGEGPNVVKGCIFFGVPHGGASLPRDWAPVLTLLNFAGVLQVDKIMDLKLKSRILNDIHNDFARIRRHHNIPVIPRKCFHFPTLF
jgi:hypothetical protein